MGYYEDTLVLEPVPEKKKYKPGTFAEIINNDYERRQAVIARNLERIEEARQLDRELNTSMMMMDRLEVMIDKVVGAIDRYTDMQSSRPPIYFNINVSSDKDQVQDTAEIIVETWNNIKGIGF